MRTKVRPLIAKARAYLQRELIHRNIPHGLVSWRYLLPSRNPLVRLHRSLWWNSDPRLPRIAWLGIEFYLYLRWILLQGWTTSYYLIRAVGPRIQETEGISIAHQIKNVLQLSLGWGIPPQEIYQYGLYKNPKLALSYIFPHEISALHQLRNKHLGLTAATIQIFQDKELLSAQLRRLQIPMVETIQCVPRKTEQSLAYYLQNISAVFCKTQSGNQGIGAFSAWKTEQGLVGQHFNGQPLSDDSAVESAWRDLLSLDNALLQPLLRSHPALGVMTSYDAVITLRYISELHPETGCIYCVSATLEIPHQTPEGHVFSTVLDIEPLSGKIQPHVIEEWKPERTKQTYLAAWQAHPDIVPFWQVLADASHRAHSAYPSVRAIAWDWTITPDGPKLLEGNLGWGAANAQLFVGGMAGHLFKINDPLSRSV